MLHLLLAFNLIASAAGVGVYEHLCQMQGLTIAVVQAPAVCHAEQESKSKKACCHKDDTVADGPVLTQQPCCSNTASWLAVDLEATSPALQLVASSPGVAVVPVLAKAELPFNLDIPTLGEKVVRAMRYKPPCPDVDVRVRVQSFLI